MSSLWTPDGEHRVPRAGEPERPAASPPREGAPPAAPAGGGKPAAGANRPQGELGPDGVEGLSDEELEAVTRQLLSAPVEDVVANHCYGLFELAALHLSQQPPGLAEARIAIDALALVVDGLGARLGPHASALAEGLSQIRMAWVRIAEAAQPG